MPGKRDLTLLFGVRLLSAMGVTLILPVMPAMARTFGLSIAEAGMVVVCFTLAEATMTPVAGVLSDRFGRMAVLLPALLVFAGGGILCLFAESWRDVLICRVIQGIGAGPLGVLYTILAADMVDEKHLPRIMGRLTAVSSLGTIVYPVIGGLLGEWSWRAPFFVFTLALPTAVLSLMVTLEKPQGAMDWRRYWKQTGNILRERRAIGFCAGIFVLLRHLWAHQHLFPDDGRSEVPRIFVSYRPCLFVRSHRFLLGGRRAPPPPCKVVFPYAHLGCGILLYAASGFSGLRSGFVALRGASVRFRCGAGAFLTHHQR